MRLSDFEAMVQRMAREVPGEYLEGIAEIQVSPHALPHPLRPEIYTLGECIPLPAVDGSLQAIQSRIVLYHGSFQALARLDPVFDWREEAWETLTHELKHHLEWRANVPRLEALDRAAEANFARQDGEPFDPLFYLDGEPVAEGVYRVEQDHFLDRVVSRWPPGTVTLGWHGRAYEVTIPDTASPPVLVSLAGLRDPPPGEVILVLRRRPGLRDLFRRSAASQLELEVEPVDDGS